MASLLDIIFGKSKPDATGGQSRADRIRAAEEAAVGKKPRKKKAASKGNQGFRK